MIKDAAVSRKLSSRPPFFIAASCSPAAGGGGHAPPKNLAPAVCAKIAAEGGGTRCYLCINIIFHSFIHDTGFM